SPPFAPPIRHWPVRAVRKWCRLEATRFLRSAAERRFLRFARCSAHRGRSTLSRARSRGFAARAIEQLARVNDGRVGDFFSAEHAGDLGDAFFAVIQSPHACPRVPLRVFFPYEEVRCGEAGDLR